MSYQHYQEFCASIGDISKDVDTPEMFDIRKSTYLGHYWHVMIEAKPFYNCPLDYPQRLAKGMWRSQNSDVTDMDFIGQFISVRRPRKMVECGILEARGTEFFIRRLLADCPLPIEYVAIDADSDINHIDEDSVTFYSDEERGYHSVREVREARIKLFKVQQEYLSFTYLRGLTRYYLEDLVTKFQPDFIYQDASHMTNLLVQEWGLIEKSNPPYGTVICFDDMNKNGIANNPDKHEFVYWFHENVDPKKWAPFGQWRERGQLWVEKVKEGE